MKIKILLSVIVLGATLFAACKKSSDETTPTPTPDTAPPVITVNGSNPYSVSTGTTYTDPGATATDAVDGSVIVTNNKSGTNPNMSVAGTYTITYTASDKAANTATATRKVIVISGAGYSRADYLWSYSTTSAPYGYSAHDVDLVNGAVNDYTGCTISAGTGPNDIKIGCFLNTLSYCYATINGATLTLTSPQTFYPYTISNGSGTLNSGKNQITITYRNDTEGHNHTVVLTK